MSRKKEKNISLGIGGIPIEPVQFHNLPIILPENQPQNSNIKKVSKNVKFKEENNNLKKESNNKDIKKPIIETENHKIEIPKKTNKEEKEEIIEQDLIISTPQNSTTPSSPFPISPRRKSFLLSSSPISPKQSTFKNYSIKNETKIENNQYASLPQTSKRNLMKSSSFSEGKVKTMSRDSIDNENDNEFTIEEINEISNHSDGLYTLVANFPLDYYTKRQIVKLYSQEQPEVSNKIDKQIYNHRQKNL